MNTVRRTTPPGLGQSSAAFICGKQDRCRIVPGQGCFDVRHTGLAHLVRATIKSRFMFLHAAVAGDFPCRALPLHTRAAVTIPADWPVAFIARFPSHTSLPPSSYRVGIRITLFGTCSTFTTRCSPRVRRITHGDPLLRRLRSLRYLHDRSNGYRLERQLPGGSTPHWESARFHGARN